jgi:S1-C subfamily serine protease
MVTAAHVVQGCQVTNLILLGASLQSVNVTGVEADDDLDLAVLTLASTIQGSTLDLSLEDKSPVGIQVIAWGFPAGYIGVSPLLSVGYLAGVNLVRTDSGKLVKKLVVNAAFNQGNSGGPVVNAEDGSVIGVVSSKLAPLPDHIENILNVLENLQTGLMHTAKKADGTEIEVSQGRLIGIALQYLRSQTQLVIGHAVPVKDVREFLKKAGINP